MQKINYEKNGMNFNKLRLVTRAKIRYQPNKFVAIVANIAQKHLNTSYV